MDSSLVPKVEKKHTNVRPENPDTVNMNEIIIYSPTTDKFLTCNLGEEIDNFNAIRNPSSAAAKVKDRIAWTEDLFLNDGTTVNLPLDTLVVHPLDFPLEPTLSVKDRLLHSVRKEVKHEIFENRRVVIAPVYTLVVRHEYQEVSYPTGGRKNRSSFEDEPEARYDIVEVVTEYREVLWSEEVDATVWQQMNWDKQTIVDNFISAWRAMETEFYGEEKDALLDKFIKGATQNIGWTTKP